LLDNCQNIAFFDIFATFDLNNINITADIGNDLRAVDGFDLPDVTVSQGDGAVLRFDGRYLQRLQCIGFGRRMLVMINYIAKINQAD
jgi:hypothetical protein